KENNLDENTIVMLMGDNGFLFGEHGMIDKRNAYEESMRVPLLAVGPGFEGGQQITEVVANLDIAPTILALAGVEKPAHFQGESFATLPTDEAAKAAWNNEFAYEYFWEYSFPQNPTTFAVRTDKYKLIQYHGIWDREELYDMENDPTEMNNLALDPEHEDTVVALRKRIYALMADGKGRHIVPYTERKNGGNLWRGKNTPDALKASDFPKEWLKKGRNEQ
ncbi:MAG: DUF4976 domain-containing protein, partial [Kordiimonadaceae bacterium]|nr:DUF4976 domain-containing protein [Kordiimonadaceae bacterium]